VVPTELKTLELTLDSRLEAGTPVYKTLLESLPYYLGDQYAVSVEGDKLVLDNVPVAAEAQLARAALEAFVAARNEHERVDERCLHSFEGNHSLHDGVYEALVEQGAVLPTGFGKLAYTGIVADALQGLDRFFKERCLALGAQQEFYPPALEAESLLRAGYFNTLAQHSYFVSPLKTNLDALRAAGEGEVLHASGEKYLQAPCWVMSPTVCHHCFEARKDSSLQLPLKVTAINQCARYEIHDTHGMRRLRLYWMRECILFDEAESTVVEFLDNLLEITTDALQAWGISHEVVTANDPFFSNSATSKRAYQSMFALKRELKLPIPGGSISCASFNNHQRSLVEPFNIGNIGSTDGKDIASGCVGWGYDRLLFALFCQLGVEVAGWPERVLGDLGL
jgi:seryl-tRNA synthetase